MPVSLDAQVYGTGASLAESLADERWGSPLEAITADCLERSLAGAMAELADRERDILSRHYGLGHETGVSLEAIGKSTSLSRERIRQLRNRALEEIRGSIRYRDLAEYLNQ